MYFTFDKEIIFMIPKQITFSLIAILAASSFITQAEAKARYLNAVPAEYNGAIGCGSCHAGTPESERNATLPYAITFDRFVDDDFLSANSFKNLEQYDSDGDGFSNGQEIYGGSSFNASSDKPILPDATHTDGVVSAKPTLNQTITSLTTSTSTPANPVNNTKLIGGTINYTMNNVPAKSDATATFMFSTGGVQTGASTYFVDNNDALSLISTTSINIDGSISVTVADEGPFDLYTKASYIATAKTRTPATGANLTKDPYATVSPLAVIGHDVTIKANAKVGAYAIVDNYATVDTYAVVDDYAVVSAREKLTSNAIRSIPTSYEGNVQSRMVVATTSPTIPAGQGGGDNDSDNDGESSAGGLHCMSTGLGTQGTMLSMLLLAGFLIRRRASTFKQ